MYEIDKESTRLIEDAIHKKGTDIHFIPQKSHCYVHYRIHGEMLTQRKITHHVAERMISHFKYMSGMDIGERRKPQSMAMSMQSTKGLYSLRISTLPANGTESMAIRLIPQTQLQSLTELPLISNQLKKLQQITKLRNGLVLLCGPTGSGKTTTLYGMANEMIQEQTRALITIEDPVERILPTTIQLEVNQRAGLTFESGLRAILRHDPDVIIVGEIRDQQTAALAIRAALTGHLVIASIHTTDAYQAVLRFQEYGLSKMELAEVCQAIVAQRLVGTVWKHQSALYEILDGDLLTSAVLTDTRPNYYQLIHAARKAWTLGFISSEMVKRMEEWT